MLQRILLLIIILASKGLLFGQDVAGNWYEIQDSNSNLEITIDNNDGTCSGTFNWEWKNWINTINTPLNNVLIKNDSLFFELTFENRTFNYKLHWKDSTDTYEGFFYLNSRQLDHVILSRTPIQSDLTKINDAKIPITKQDSIRGMITPEREWWDLTYYHLEIKVDPENKYISGKTTIQYKVEKPYSIMQIDLQAPLTLTKANQNGVDLDIQHAGNAHYIHFNDDQEVGKVYSVEVFYEGNPAEAANAPWDGGFSWKKDNNGNHFIATSCQEIGASIWWPCKDHMYDEVDSMLISVTNPKGLSNISNGRLR